MIKVSKNSSLCLFWHHRRISTQSFCVVILVMQNKLIFFPLIKVHILKMCQNLTFKVNSLLKSSESFSTFFHWRMTIEEHIFCYWHFLIKSIFKSLHNLYCHSKHSTYKWELSNHERLQLTSMVILMCTPMACRHKCRRTLTMTWFKCSTLSGVAIEIKVSKATE